MATIAGKVPSPAQAVANIVECYAKMQESGTSDSTEDYESDSYRPGYGKIDADKGDGPGTVPNDPNYLRNNTQYINRSGDGM